MGTGASRKFWRLIVVAITAVAVMTLPDVVGAQTGPTISANLTYDNVWGSEFSPASLVSVQIRSSAEGPTLYEGTTTTNGDGAFWVDANVHGQNLTAGMWISASDGTTTKELTLAALTIEVLDRVNDTVSGTGPPSTPIAVDVFDHTGRVGFVVTSAPDGTWFADFAGQFDITRGTDASLAMSDSDGDGTHLERPAPKVWASLTGDDVGGTWFAPNGSVDITISGTPGHTATTATDERGNWFLSHDQHGVNLVPGTIVTASDGQVTKVLTLVPLTVETIDIDLDAVSGTAVDGTPVSVGVNSPTGGWANRPATTDDSGIWTVSFAPEFDVTTTTQVNATVNDSDGDWTQVDKSLPRMSGSLSNEGISGRSFAPNATLDVTISGTPEFTGTTTADPYGNFQMNGVEHGRDLAVGTVITVSDGTNSKTLTLASLTVDGRDTDLDTIWGTAPATTQVNVYVGDGMGGGGTGLQPTSDGDGHWTADFSGQWDITMGTTVHLEVDDGDGDTTQLDSNPPQIWADLDHDGFGGNGFAPSTTLDYTIAGDPGFSGTVDTDPSGSFNVPSEAHGQDLVVGTVLTVSDPVWTKVLTLVSLSIDARDVDLDTVSGTAPPNTPVGVGASNGMGGGGTGLQTTSDGDGAWTADFSGQWDITMGTNLGASVSDEDGDRTQASSNPPVINVGIRYDNIGGWGFAPNASVSIDISGTPGYSGTAPTDANGSFGLGRDQHGQDLLPGTVVTVTDGEWTKDLTVALITIEEVDSTADTVSGTAPIGAWVSVNVGPTMGGSGSGLQVIADPTTGAWTASFAGLYDITGGTQANASVNDIDGDQTMTSSVAPYIRGVLNADQVQGEGFTPGATVDVTISGEPGFVGSAPIDGAGTFTLFRFGGHEMNLVPGLVITVEQGALVRQVTLVDLSIDALDPVTDIVSGHAAAGTTVDVQVQTPWGPRVASATANADGEWAADFSGVADLTSGSGATAAVPDEDGDLTQAMWQAPNFQVSLTQDQIRGFSFPATTDVTVTIFDSYGGAELFSGTVTTDDSGQFWYGRGGHGQDLLGGQYVEVTAGAITKGLFLVPLTFDTLNVSTDIGAGTAPAGTSVNLHVQQTGTLVFNVPATDGTWAVDFMATSGLDITPEMLESNPVASVWVSDNDGDIVGAGYVMPRFDADIVTDQIESAWSTWAPSSTVTVDIYDEPGGTLLHSDVVATDTDGSFSLDKGVHTVDLAPGMQVVVTQGTTTKALTLVFVTTDTFSALTGTASGRAVPGATVTAWWQGDNLGDGVTVVADETGHWVANFGYAPIEHEVFQSGAYVADTDRDHTVARYVERRRVAHDFDGDGDADISVFRPTTGEWFVQGQEAAVFGRRGDIPVSGDYDGDGDTDMAVYRPTTGRWYINGTPGSIASGTSRDTPVPADYDGDGDTDIAVYRSTTGEWSIQGQGSVTLGRRGDIPVPADYDGDGDADIAVFRPTTGRWYINGTPGSIAWGTSRDIPLP